MSRNRSAAVELESAPGEVVSEPNSPIVIKLVTVTPEMAKRWLAHNYKDNRSLKQPKVDAICGDIDSGNWRTTHQPICFDADDVLIDGQHRLAAIIQAGKSVKMLVAFSSLAQYDDPIDTGTPRSIGLILGKSQHLVATCNVLRSLEVGYMMKTPQTPAEIQATYERHEKYLDILEAAHFPKRALLGPVRAAIVWSLPIDVENPMTFARLVVSGEMIRRGDPAYAYRNWRERNARSEPWLATMATFNCLAHQIRGYQLKMVYTGPTGYRAITGARRKDKIEHTPSMNLVPAGHWPTSDAKGEDSPE